MSFISSILNEVRTSLENRIERSDDINPGKSVGTDFRPSDVNLESITITSTDNKRRYSLMSQVTRIDIFESIYSPVIYAELQIQDSIGLDQNFPIKGEEYISIIFSTPGSESTEYQFINRGIPVNKKLNENLKGSTYTLKLVSVDALKNLLATSLNNKGEFVSKFVKDNVTGIVKDILKEDLKVALPVNVVNTKGIFEESITYGLSISGSSMTPFRYIDKFKNQLAAAVQYESSAFHFFLNKHGYFFTTKEKLIEDGSKLLSKNKSDKRFVFDAVRNVDKKNVTMRNILAFNQVNNAVDTLDYMFDSGFAGSATTLDLLTFGTKTVTYTDNVGADKFKKTDEDSGNMFTTDFTRKFGKTITNSRLVTGRADLPDRGLAEKLVKSQAFAAKMGLNELQIEVYGDSELTVGNVIECTLPASTASEETADKMRLYSGNYLVAALRHMIINGDRPQHIISMALEKNGLVE